MIKFTGFCAFALNFSVSFSIIGVSSTSILFISSLWFSSFEMVSILLVRANRCSVSLSAMFMYLFFISGLPSSLPLFNISCTIIIVLRGVFMSCTIAYEKSSRIWEILLIFDIILTWYIILPITKIIKKIVEIRRISIRSKIEICGFSRTSCIPFDKSAFIGMALDSIENNELLRLYLL